MRTGTSKHFAALPLEPTLATRQNKTHRPPPPSAPLKQQPNTAVRYAPERSFPMHSTKSGAPPGPVAASCRMRSTTLPLLTPCGFTSTIDWPGTTCRARGGAGRGKVRGGTQGG